MFSSIVESVCNNLFNSPIRIVQCDKEKSDHQHVPKSIIKASDFEPSEAFEFGSLRYFTLCGVCGILSCGSTHTLVVPLDLVKTRLQVDKAKYKNLFYGLKVTVAEEGIRGLGKGWTPTLIGYSAQVTQKLIFKHSFPSFKRVYSLRVSSSLDYMKSSK